MSAIFAAALLCLAIAIAVFLANPRRFPNHAFAFGAVLVATWLFFIFGAVHAEHALTMGQPNRLTFYLRANNVVIALWPWTLWLIRQSLLTPDHEKWQTIRSSWPWSLIAAVAIILTQVAAFAEIDRSGLVRRGWPYALYIATLCSAVAAFVAETWRLMRNLDGIRRLEIRFLVLNLGYGALIGTTLLFIGNTLHNITVKAVGLVVFGAPYVLITWAVTVYRVFDARQILLSIGHRVGLIAAGAGAILAVQPVVQGLLPSHEALFVSGLACCGALIWLDHKTRGWLGLDGRRTLERIRRTVIDLSRTEAATDELTRGFEALLRRECQVDTATLIPNVAAGNTPNSFPFDHPGHAALRKIGWATPETLRRRRRDDQRLQLLAFLEERSLGLLLAVPRGSPTPSLLLAFGMKMNRGPFTYPEVERLIGIAELMDNILARSRLTTQAALQAKTEHVAMMSRGLAHDLNNLITPISSFLVHIDGQFPADSPQADVYGHATRSVKVMQDYVRDAMFFGKRLAPKLQAVRLEKTLRTVSDLTMQRARQRGIEVVSPAECSLELIADSLLIQRLLTNLVNNAVDASGRGQAVRIHAEARASGIIRIVVVDEGCGIAPENLSRVFEPYFTTKQYGDEVRGFGLGLSICRKIVHLHGGAIRIESEIGRGTAVIVDLPAKPPEHRETLQPEMAQSTSPGSSSAATPSAGRPEHPAL